MDFTDEEIDQLLGENLHDQPDLASHARIELSKAPPVANHNYNIENAASFLSRMCSLLQSLRSQLKYPSDPEGWVLSDRLQLIFKTACVFKNPDTKSYAIEESYRSGLEMGLADAWLEKERFDEWVSR